MAKGEDPAAGTRAGFTRWTRTTITTITTIAAITAGMTAAGKTAADVMAGAVIAGAEAEEGIELHRFRNLCPGVGFYPTMKTIALLAAATVGILATAHSAEAPKQLLQLSAKKQVLGADHDKFGRAGSSKEKTYTLRVVLYNATSATVAESVLSGTALVARAGESSERIVKESLGEVKVPAMKPNEKITLDLGKIELREVAWGKRKFEENLEEWQVKCSQGEVEIGKAQSSDNYVLLARDAATDGPQRPGRGDRGDRRPGRFFKR